MRLFLLSIISFCILMSSAAYADNTTSAAKPKPLAPVTFQDGNIFDPMKFAIIGKYVYFDQFKIHTGSSKDDPGFGKRRRTAHAGQLTFRAGLLEGFEAFLTATAFDKELERKNAKGLTDESDIQGLGDIQVMGRWQALTQKKGDPLSLALGLGLEIPTADSDNRNSFGTQPYMGPFLQLSTGSWNPKASLSASRVFGRSRLDGQLMYTLNTEGEHDLEKGDMFQYDLGYGFALSKCLTAGLAMNGAHQEKNTQQMAPGVTKKDPNSGCDMIFLGPELSVRVEPLNMVLGLAAPITVYADMDGTQPVEDYRVVAKLAVQF